MTIDNYSEMTAMRLAGASTKEIAKKFGISKPQVSRILLYQCGIKPHSIYVREYRENPRRSEAQALKQGGMSYAEIGTAMGITRQRAQQLVSPVPSKHKEMIENSGGQCSDCGRKVKKLHAHHSDYAGDPDKVLCTSCHKKSDWKDGFGMKSCKNGGATGTNVSLYPQDRAIIKGVKKSQGRKTFSDALQHVIREYPRLLEEIEKLRARLEAKE